MQATCNVLFKFLKNSHSKTKPTRNVTFETPYKRSVHIESNFDLFWRLGMKQRASVTNEKLFHVNSSRLHFDSSGDNVIYILNAAK